jgi:hypothetical protein
MKKNIILSLMCIITQACFSQKEITSKIDFFDVIKPSSVDLIDCSLYDKTTISFFCRGFNDLYTANKNGVGVFYAIPKIEYKIWKIENITNLERKELFKNSTGKIKMAKELLTIQKDTLLEYFDLYVFYVGQNDTEIEGSSMTDDGQLMDDFYIKDDATVYTYRYENGIWIETGKNNLNGRGLASFGDIVVKKILQERFAEAEVKENSK